MSWNYWTGRFLSPSCCSGDKDLRVLQSSLPEKRPLPRSEIFAKSKNAGSRQRKRLPSAALGKHRPSASDRIAVGLHLGKQQLSAKWAVLPRAALGKKCPSAKRSFAVGRPLGKIRLLAKHCRGPIAVTCPDGVTALPRAPPLLLSAKLFAERRSRQIFAESPSQALGKCGFYISCACVSLLLTLSN